MRAHAAGAGRERAGTRPAVLGLWTLVLFLVWSNSFVAASVLLGGEGAPARFDATGMVAARFLPVTVLSGLWCLVLRPAPTRRLLRAHGWRCLACGLLCVPVYNLALFHGQAGGLPAPVASLLTTLSPLFLLVLGALVLGERLTARKLVGFAVALAGVAVIAGAKELPAGASYARVVLVTALAPLSWSAFTVLSKPVTREHDPLHWTWLCLFIGGLFVLPVLPFRGGAQMLALDAAGWGALLYLGVACAFACFALWTWLLQRLPASTIGLTVFLNPPLTAASKAALAWIDPQAFPFQVSRREWAGGALVLLGLAIALRVLGWRRRPRGVAPLPAYNPALVPENSEKRP